MTSIPFVALDDPRYGEAVQISPLIRRVIAHNPSRFTYHGTGTYIVGHGDVAVIDPGPALDEHRAALASALRGERVVAIVVTHCHSDHSPLAGWLAEHTGAPTYGVGPHVAAAHDWPTDQWPDFPIPAEDLAQLAAMGADEAVDHAFDPTVRVADGDTFAAGEGWRLVGVHTPGHAANHLCVALPEERALFTGDHVMGWSTTVVSPPDGDMDQYLASLRRVIERDDAVLYPTHGAPITEPGPFLQAYLQHRLDREQQILDALRHGHGTLDAIVAELYADVHPALHHAAARSVFAHLLGMISHGQVDVVEGPPHPLATFVAAGSR